MSHTATIGNHNISLKGLQHMLRPGTRLTLDPKHKEFIAIQRQHLENILDKNDLPIYGINTGFGALCNTVIPDHQLNELQSNLVRSHACGFGDPISPELSRLVLLLKIIGLSRGISAVRVELIEFLIWLYNEDLIPVIPQMGSLGASGDLAPLAHLSLPCIGEGLIYFQGEVHETKSLIENKILIPPYLKAKEGLALLNGTQFSLALLIHSVIKARHAYHTANRTAALSMEAFNCNLSYLHPKIHEFRNQRGQIDAANELGKLMAGSDIQSRENKSVQDPYSFRCAPQVHGASLDVIRYCEQIAANEINAVTDNPLLISEDEVVSGGNFHAQPLALASDFLSLALAELANISERRLYQLVCGGRGLPDFLTTEPGLNSGYMIVQYAAAAAVSMNKQFATPSSVDSIISSKGQEDHVSMAANAGLKCLKIAANTEMVLAMEWMTAARAWHSRKNWKLDSILAQMVDAYRKILPYKTEDHIPSQEYDTTISFLKDQLPSLEN